MGVWSRCRFDVWRLGFFKNIPFKFSSKIVRFSSVCLFIVVLTKNKLQKLDPEKSVANFCRKFILVPEKHHTGFVEAINAEQRRFSTKSVPHISDSPRSPPPVTISMEKTKLLFIHHFMSNIGEVIWRKKNWIYFLFLSYSFPIHVWWINVSFCTWKIVQRFHGFHRAFLD